MGKSPCRRCGGSQPKAALLSQNNVENFIMQPDLVQININAPLPMTVVLPLRLHSEYKVDRRFVITSRTQLVPAGVKAWMRADKHYARYFSAEESPAVVQSVVTPSTPRSHSKKAAPAPNPSESAAKTAPPGGKDAGYDPAWNVTALRNYAAAHKIALTRDDNKREALIAKLRAAGLKPIAPPAAEPVTPPATEPEKS